MDILTLSAFIVTLIIFLVLDISIVFALLAGLAMFCLYALSRGFSLRQLGGMIFSGVRTAGNILVVFVLIGMLTALWRACGTIPAIICYAMKIITPGIVLPMSFLLCAGVSVLTGTSFGTAATMGVICMAMANAMGLPPLLSGGAILAGIFWGDRCSPVSTSALLVATTTKTDIYANIRAMLRTSGLPTILSCLIYYFAGRISGGAAGQLPDVETIFRAEFVLRPVLILPAALILILALLRVKVKIAMFVSIAASALLCLLIQQLSPGEVLRTAVLGYQSGSPEIARLLSGGGITSMLRVMAIVGISSTFSGIFRETGMLQTPHQMLERLSRRFGSYVGILTTALITAMISCNQALATMLTAQLCEDIEPDKEALALSLEDTVIVIAPLIPWSIAGAVPLSTIGAPSGAVLAACYLYLLPIFGLVRSLRRKACQGGRSVSPATPAAKR